MKHLSELLIILGLFILCMALGQTIVLVSLSIFYGIEPNAETLRKLIDIQKLLQHDDGVWILYFMQGAVSLCSMLLSGFIFRAYFAQKPLQPLNTNKLQARYAVIATVLMLVILPFVSQLVWWNNQVSFPSFLADWEKMLRDKHTSAHILTDVFTRFPTFLHFATAVLVMAVIAASAEEVWFRGILQKKLQDILPPQIAIFLTGFIFALSHSQFFNIIPLFLLGTLLGYLYWWSGNLWVSILAHFVNNFATLVAIYLYNLKIVPYNLYHPHPVTWYWVVLSLGASIGLLYIFRGKKAEPSKV
jgi:membrane protease YdiL (CAAX protease family)